MKIALCLQANSKESRLDDRFGQAEVFAIFDSQIEKWEFIPNIQNTGSAQGAGMQAAQKILDAAASTLIASNIGPKAFTVLQAAGVAVYQASPQCDTAAQAIHEFLKGNLTAFNNPNVEGHWI